MVAVLISMLCPTYPDQKSFADYNCVFVYYYFVIFYECLIKYYITYFIIYILYRTVGSSSNFINFVFAVFGSVIYKFCELFFVRICWIYYWHFITMCYTKNFITCIVYWRFFSGDQMGVRKCNFSNAKPFKYYLISSGF